MKLKLVIFILAMHELLIAAMMMADKADAVKMEGLQTSRNELILGIMANFMRDKYHGKKLSRGQKAFVKSVYKQMTDLEKELQRMNEPNNYWKLREG